MKETSNNLWINTTSVLCVYRSQKYCQVSTSVSACSFGIEKSFYHEYANYLSFIIYCTVSCHPGEGKFKNFLILSRKWVYGMGVRTYLCSLNLHDKLLLLSHEPVTQPFWDGNLVQLYLSWRKYLRRAAVSAWQG